MKRPRRWAWVPADRPGPEMPAGFAVPPNAGLWSAPSRGSSAIAVWPRLGTPPSQHRDVDLPRHVPPHGQKISPCRSLISRCPCLQIRALKVVGHRMCPNRSTCSVTSLLGARGPLSENTFCCGRTVQRCAREARNLKIGQAVPLQPLLILSRRSADPASISRIFVLQSHGLKRAKAAPGALDHNGNDESSSQVRTNQDPPAGETCDEGRRAGQPRRNNRQNCRSARQDRPAAQVANEPLPKEIACLLLDAQWCVSQHQVASARHEAHPHPDPKLEVSW